MTEIDVSQGKRSSLHPSFVDAIGAIFRRARNAKGLFSILSNVRNKGVSVSSILEMHDPRWVSLLADQIRRATETEWYYVFSAGRAWTAEADLRLAKGVLRVDAESAYPLLTMWSGYVREAAVRAVERIPGPFCLSLLVHRMNDWVAQVRVAAEAKLASLIDAIDAATTIECIELLWEFDRFGRASKSARLLVERLAHDPIVLKSLRDEALKGRTDRALRIVRRLLRTDALDDTLVAMATTNPHLHIRACATRALLTQTVHWRDASATYERRVGVEADVRSLAMIALNDRASVVRLAGLEYVVANGRTWDDYESILVRFVADPRNSLAETARWGLKEMGVDWIERLRASLVDRGIPRPHVARALGRFGSTADGERICELASVMSDAEALPLLAASALQKTEAAIERLRDLAIRGADAVLARRASRALRDAAVSLTPDDLLAIADRGDEFFSRGLGRHLGVQRVVVQLNVLARLERARADFDLGFWFSRADRKINRGAFTMSDSERTELDTLLTQAPKVRERARRMLAIGL